MTKSLLIICLIFYTAGQLSGEDTSATVDFYEPYPIQDGAHVLQIGGSLTLLPPPVVESEIPLPAFDIQYKVGFASNWSFIAIGSSNIFSTLVYLGPQWNESIDNFSVGIGLNLGAFFGFITSDSQFDDNWNYGVGALPIVRFGYRFDDVTTSVSFAASYLLASESKASGIKNDGPSNSVNDLFITIAVEQPFLEDKRIATGVSLTYSRTPYQTWLLYNTIDQFLFIPEFFFAVHI